MTQQSGTTANPIQLNNNAPGTMNNNSRASMNNTAPRTADMSAATTERPMQADRN